MSDHDLQYEDAELEAAREAQDNERIEAETWDDEQQNAAEDVIEAEIGRFAPIVDPKVIRKLRKARSHAATHLQVMKQRAVQGAGYRDAATIELTVILLEVIDAMDPESKDIEG